MRRWKPVTAESQISIGLHPLDVNAFEESALKLATEAVRNAGMAEFLASIAGQTLASGSGATPSPA